MELRVVRYFDAVARLGSATAAAEELHVAQPAISRQLKMLERQVGVQLFTPTASGTKLTVAGARFAEIAADLLVKAQELEDFARADTQDTAALRIACIAATMEHVLTRMIAAGELLATQVTVVKQADLFDHLLDNSADVALTLSPAEQPLVSILMRWLHVTIQVPPQLDRWDAGAPVLVEELVDVPLVTLTTRSPSRQRLEAAAEADGVLLTPDVGTEQAGVAQAIAAQRVAACVVTEERPDFDFRWHPLHSRTLGCLGMNLYATWDPTHYMNPAILRLVETFQTTEVRSLVRLPSCRPDRPRG